MCPSNLESSSADLAVCIDTCAPISRFFPPLLNVIKFFLCGMKVENCSTVLKRLCKMGMYNLGTRKRPQGKQ